MAYTKPKNLRFDGESRPGGGFERSVLRKRADAIIRSAPKRKPKLADPTKYLFGPLKRPKQ